MAPGLLFLLDVPVEDPHWISLDPRQRRQQTMDALRRLVLRESQVQPLCLVIEDLHWIDSETQECLDGLVESLPAARILLLVNYRPGVSARVGEPTGLRRSFASILWRRRSAEELLRVLLGDDDDGSLAPLERLLVERTEGNPFFLEESVRTLVESGVLVGERGAYRLARPVETVRVPPTVAGRPRRADRPPGPGRQAPACSAPR